MKVPEPHKGRYYSALTEYWEEDEDGERIIIRQKGVSPTIVNEIEEVREEYGEEAALKFAFAMTFYKIERHVAKKRLDKLISYSIEGPVAEFPADKTPMYRIKVRLRR